MAIWGELAEMSFLVDHGEVAGGDETPPDADRTTVENVVAPVAVAKPEDPRGIVLFDQPVNTAATARVGVLENGDAENGLAAETTAVAYPDAIAGPDALVPLPTLPNGAVKTGRAVSTATDEVEFAHADVRYRVTVVRPDDVLECAWVLVYHAGGMTTGPP